MSLNTNDEHFWDEFAKMLAQINVDAIANEHLDQCGYRITGYWHENEYYEEIRFPESVCAELVSASIGISKSDRGQQNWIQFKLSLFSEKKTPEDNSISENDTRIGELTLIFNSQMEFLDEKWLINIKSPFVVAIKGAQVP
jgi:hypothetical protein